MTPRPTGAPRPTTHKLQAIPPATIANHTTRQWERKRRMMEYLQVVFFCLLTCM